MPTVTRYHIKSGLIYFVAALLMGAVVAAQPILDLPLWLGVLRPVYLHLLMVGWVTQLIIGVVYWMFPKFTKDNPRGSERLAWAVYLLLNGGLLIRAVAEPLVTLDPAAGAGWLLAVSAVMQLLAGWGFVANTWRRVKER